MLTVPDLPEGAPRHRVREQDHGLDIALDQTLIQLCEGALLDARPVRLELPVRNVNRTVGTMLGVEVTRRFGGEGLPDGTIDLTFTGSAGQSFGAFLPRGITMRLFGDANDYVGKGLSGGRIVVRPAREATVRRRGQRDRRQRDRATARPSGEIFLRGRVGERFCVRNSGALAVVEGVGDHACEYMTGGRAVILGPTGRNVAAGMSGGDRLRARPRPAPGEHRDGRRRAAGRRVGGLAARGPGALPGGDGVAGRRGAAGRLGPLVGAVQRDHAARLPAGAGGPADGRGQRDGCRSSSDGGGSWVRRVADWRPTGCRRRRRRHVADPTGFLKYDRELPPRRPVDVRITDWKDVYLSPAEGEDAVFPVAALREQAARCMDCGIPFCHHGCPLGNLIPEWNDLTRRGDWREASERLHATNNFPEFTGKLCPAPCEGSCVLNLQESPVTIKQIEWEISEQAHLQGFVTPLPPQERTGKKVAVIGSGPAGLAAAQQLTRAGHDVTVFERADRVGGLLRYGIPEFKMEKRVVDRRLDQLRAEGTRFVTGVEVGGGGENDLSVEQLRAEFDAVVLAGGATVGRDLPAPGRELDGIHQAMEYLPFGNRQALGELDDPPINAARQARGDHRGRRHRRRLPGDGASPGGRLGHPAGDHAGAAGEPGREQPVADLPHDHAGFQRARGGRRAALRRQHRALPGRRAGPRPRAAPARGGPGRRPVLQGRGHRARAQGGAGAAGDGVHRCPARGAGSTRSAWRSTAEATWPATTRSCPACPASSSPVTWAAASR